MALFFLPRARSLDSNANPYSGAKLYFYYPETTSEKDTYQDSDLTILHANPVIADSSGNFPAIYLDGEYKVVEKTSGDVVIHTQDNYTTPLQSVGENNNPLESLIIPCSDESTAITAGTGKITIPWPYDATIISVKANLTTAQSSGNIFTVDVNKNGTSILSTKLTIDNTETSSNTATTPCVISNTSLIEDDLISIDVDQIGNGTAKGLKVTIVMRQPA